MSVQNALVTLYSGKASSKNNFLSASESDSQKGIFRNRMFNFAKKTNLRMERTNHTQLNIQNAFQMKNVNKMLSEN